MRFLGVKVDRINRKEAVAKAREWLAADGQHKIFTPNPEILVLADKDRYFREVLNGGDLNLCDGFGLAFFAGLPRVPGIDFIFDLCRAAEEKEKSVFLLGSGSNAVVAEAAKNLQKRFPGLKITGFDSGPTIIDKIGEKVVPKDINIQRALEEKINAARPDILFVGFGMGKQEKWIRENLSTFPSVKIAMGVGGAIDFISGRARRAPCWMRDFGLEWMYRLVRQPNRAGRIYNATFKFVWLVFKDKFHL